MPRYITEDDAFRLLSEYYHHKTYYQHVALAEAIQEVPTADVLEVVLCRDCIHGIPTRIDTVTGEFSDERYCWIHHMCHFEDYYCADGKRKEGGTE